MITGRGSDQRSDRILIFVFLGQLVGWAVVFLPLFGRLVASRELQLGETPLLDALGGAGLLLSFTLSGAYVIGFLPAWVTALLSARLMNLPTARHVGATTLIGTSLSALLFGWLGTSVALLTAAGGAAAFVCSLVALRLSQKEPRSGERG